MTQAEALAILKTGANVFLTGEPGSGKTHTVNAYAAWLRSRGIEPSITASTGIAATHIGGYTIHSWSGIGVRRDLTAYDLDALSQNRRLTERVRCAQVLIIDEVSMLSARTLSLVDAVCRELRGNGRPFGGLQVVLVGDFFQLPPVRERTPQATETLVIDYDTGAALGGGDGFAYTSRAWSMLNPLTCYLHEQHRQEDAPFLDFLSALRRGEITTAHRALLETRHREVPEVGITQLYSHNADVDRINARALEGLSGDERQFLMDAKGPEKLVAALIKGCLSPQSLGLKVGARVMFTKNNPDRGFVNGTLGIVEGFSSDSCYPVIQTRGCRSLLAEPMEWSLQDGGKVLARISQVPLRLAWAITVHKSQGMSLDGAHMDLSQAFEYGQGYVALSRVRTLRGLSLSGLNARALEVHPDIREKDVEFRASSDEAGDAFAKFSEQELAAMHANFVRACGGREPKAGAKPPRAAGAAAAEGKKYSVEALRNKHANAYRAWSEEEDADLKRRHAEGEKTKTLAETFGRQPGAIRSRLVKLGLR